jgi:hypothetical protein
MTADWTSLASIAGTPVSVMLGSFLAMYSQRRAAMRLQNSPRHWMEVATSCLTWVRA